MFISIYPLPKPTSDLSETFLGLIPLALGFYVKFLEVLCVGFDFHLGLVVAQSLKALDTLDHLVFDWLSYESNRLVKSALVQESILFFSLQNFEKLVFKVFRK